MELKLNVNKVLLLDTDFDTSLLEDNNAVVAMLDDKYVFFKIVDIDEIRQQIKEVKRNER